MTPNDTIKDALNEFATRGVVVGASPTGTLQARPASLLTTEERAWLGANAGAILAHLKGAGGADTPVVPSAGEPWDRRVAIKLMEDADALVERLGVSGHHPDVRDAAARVASAYAARDLETVRLNVSEFKLLVRDLARALKTKHVPNAGADDAAPPH